MQIAKFIFYVTDCKVVVQIPIFPEEIERKILDYEQYLIMKDNHPKFKHVVKDIKEGLKIILVDRDWIKRYYCKAGDVFWKNFVWKISLIQKLLEGPALYIGKERIVCIKGVPPRFEGMLQHPYYQTPRSQWNYQPLTRQEAKLVSYEYFHR